MKIQQDRLGIIIRVADDLYNRTDALVKSHYDHAESVLDRFTNSAKVVSDHSRITNGSILALALLLVNTLSMPPDERAYLLSIIDIARLNALSHGEQADKMYEYNEARKRIRAHYLKLREGSSSEKHAGLEKEYQEKMDQESKRFLKDFKESVKKIEQLNQLLKKQQELGQKLDDKNKSRLQKK